MATGIMNIGATPERFLSGIDRTGAQVADAANSFHTADDIQSTVDSLAAARKTLTSALHSRSYGYGAIKDLGPAGSLVVGSSPRDEARAAVNHLTLAQAAVTQMQKYGATPGAVDFSYTNTVAALNHLRNAQTGEANGLAIANTVDAVRGVAELLGR